MTDQRNTSPRPAAADLGGPGSRDPGDAAGDLRPGGADIDGELADAANAGDRAEAERLAARVFPGDGARNEHDAQLRAQAKAQGDADAQPTQDASRQQSGGWNNDAF